MKEYLPCVECGHIESGLPCGHCQDAPNRPTALALTPMQRRAMARAHARREKRRNRPIHDCAPALKTDTNWARLGTVEPGFNNNQPLESRADFERECRAKDIDVVSVKDITNARRPNLIREDEKKVQELAEKYHRA